MGQPFNRVLIENSVNVALGSGVMVIWEINKKFNLPGPYYFRLYRGRAFNDDNYEPVTDWQEEACALYDNERSLGGGLVFDVWYKIRLITGDQRSYWSEPVHCIHYWERRDWIIAKEIIRKELKLYRQYTGAYGVLLKQRLWGETCSCVDASVEESANPDCPLCSGTGIVGGYYTPMRYWCSPEPEKRYSKVDANMGLIQQVGKTFRGLSFPLLATEDVVVNQRSDERWRVGGAIQTIADIRGIPIVCSFPVQKISLDDPVYKIDVSGVE